MWRALLTLTLILTGCTRDPYPKNLSAWKLFTGDPKKLQPAQGVIPYDLNTTLFTDYATKRRFVWMPPGQSATYKPDDTFDFPQGAILAKTFSYGDRLIETRLLVNTAAGWVALPYVWNAQQTDATLDVNADPVDIVWNGQKIHYAIPNQNQCRECHDQNKITGPIGPKARHLNRDNQLANWTKIGYLRGAPADPPRQPVWNDPASGSLEARARAYLEVNCAHCHSPNGSAGNTGLYLNDLQTDKMRIGFCKTPVSAGKASANMLFDVVPGHPELSILAYRIASTEPKIMMPEIGRTIVHQEGVALIREWLASLAPSYCF
jgi:uncharacterized repeat protein (TIGR03806 family)